MALFKYIDGVKVQMTPQEEALFLAQQSIDNSDTVAQENLKNAIDALGWSRTVQYHIAKAIVGATGAVSIFPAQQLLDLETFITLYEQIPNPPVR